LPAYEEFGIDKEKLEEILNDIVFGKKYLLERKQKEVEKEVKAEIAEEEKEQLTTLEEIIATMTPFEKAILWAIGVGNRYIYEEASKN